jgi:hypothetical protein
MILRTFDSLGNQAWLLTAPNQAGFKRGFSTASQILICDHRNRTGFKISVFLDLSKAYDSVPHYLLVERLRELRCPEQIISMVYHLMIHETQSFISCNRQIFSTPVMRHRGLFQGSALSPWLFNLIIDTLAASCPDLLLFADDIVIKANNAKDAQIALDQCIAWARASEMEFNISKCGVIGTIQPLFIGKQQIPVVESYKYLGCPFDKNGANWRELINKQFTEQARLLTSLEDASLAWRPPTRLIIWKTFIKPKTDYLMGCWALWVSQQPLSTRKEFDRQFLQHHRRVLSFLYGTQITSETTLLSSIMDIGLPSINQNIAVAGLQRHIHNLACGNPLLDAINRPAFLAGSDYLLINACRSRLFQCFNNQFNIDKDTKWRSFMQQYRWTEYRKQPSTILEHYITDSARTTSGYDAILNEPDPDRLFSLIRWRRNNHFARANCKCGFRFDRGHLNRCDLISLSDDEDQEYFILEQAAIHDSINRKNHQLHGQYTIFDFLLNRGAFDSFFEKMDQLQTLLT